MRPTLITIICAVLLLMTGIETVGIINSLFRQPLFKVLVQLALTMIVLVSALGLWSMKKWGVFLFLAAQAVTIGITYYTMPPGGEKYFPYMFILPAVYCAVVIPYWKKLT